MGCLPVCALLLLTACVNARLPIKIQGPKRFDDEIAVIGGGISAIHMASLLKDKGFSKVHILASENRLGGDDIYSRRHRQTVHEMGKFMFIPATESEDVDALLSKYRQARLTEISLPTVWTTTNNHSPLDTYIREHGKRAFPNQNDDQLKATLLEYIRRLNETVRSVFRGSKAEMPEDELSWQEKFRYTGSIKDLLIRQNLVVLEPILTFLFSSMGYGRLEDIPAYYGVFFFKPKMLNNLYNRLRTNAGINGITGFKLSTQGLQALLESWTSTERMNVSLNVKISEITPVTALNKCRIEMTMNGVQKNALYDFIVFSEDLKDYVALNKYRSHDEYQILLRPDTRYMIKTLVDTAGVKRGQSPFEFYPQSFFGGDSANDYKLASSVDSFAAQSGHQGILYERNQYENSKEPRNVVDPDDNQKRLRKSAVYTQMSRNMPNVADANRVLTSYLRSAGATYVNVIETKIWKFFPHYMDRDMTNGMMYSLMNLQGKNGMWFIGKSAFFDSPLPILGYNKMLINKVQF